MRLDEYIAFFLLEGKAPPAHLMLSPEDEASQKGGDIMKPAVARDGELLRFVEALRSATAKAGIVGLHPPIKTEIVLAAGGIGNYLTKLWALSSASSYRSYIARLAIPLLERMKQLLESSSVSKDDVALIWDNCEKIAKIHQNSKAFYNSEALRALSHIKDVIREVQGLTSSGNGRLGNGRLPSEAEEAEEAEAEDEEEQDPDKEERQTVFKIQALFQTCESIVTTITRALIRGELAEGNSTEDIVRAIGVVKEKIEAAGGSCWPPHDPDEIREALFALRASVSELLALGAMANLDDKVSKTEKKGELQKVLNALELDFALGYAAAEPLLISDPDPDPDPEWNHCVFNRTI